MLTSDFDFELPDERIAQIPCEPRDHSRLMVVDKKTHDVQSKHFYDIVEYCKAGDLLVWNNSKVFKARLHGRVMLDEVTDNLAKTTGQETSPFSDVILNIPIVEIFLVRPMENEGVWKVLAKPGRKLRLGMKVVFAEDFVAEVICKEKDGTILVQFNEDDVGVRAKANKYGEVPLPPYIGKQQNDIPTVPLKGEVTISPLRGKQGVLHNFDQQYQTVYAKEEGSVAAPTAGFHFTPELIQKLKDKGVQFAEVTLHVGLGTFLPVKADAVEEHRMHSEWVEITATNADLINQAKAEGRRVVAVGTTTVRTLEGVAMLQTGLQQSDFRLRDTPTVPLEGEAAISPLRGKQGVFLLRPYSGDINIFITPGFNFKIVDAMITNFHLPKSTLLMLVSAFVGNREFVLECYRKAVEEKYRFYSFGDAMIIG